MSLANRRASAAILRLGGLTIRLRPEFRVRCVNGAYSEVGSAPGTCRNLASAPTITRSNMQPEFGERSLITPLLIQLNGPDFGVRHVLPGLRCL